MTGTEDKVRVPDNGWQLLIAMLAAETVSQDLITVVSDVEDRPMVREEIRDRAGVVTSLSYRSMTDDEVERMAEDIDGYLLDAGVTPLPRPAAVYLTLPPGVESMDELCAVLQANARTRMLVLPTEWATALRELLPALYGSRH